MKLGSLLVEYDISLETLVAYLRETGVVLKEPVRNKTQVPNELKADLDSKFGINYQSKRKDSRYMIWRRELPLIHREALELVMSHPAGMRVDKIIRLLVSVVGRLQEYSLEHPDVKPDAQKIISTLLSSVNEKLDSVQGLEKDKQRDLKKRLFSTIKKQYNLFLDAMEEDKVLFDKEIPWEYVVFKDGGLWIKDKSGKRIFLPFSESKEVYNLFHYAFNDRIPSLTIRFHSKLPIEIVETPELKDIFEFLEIENNLRLGNFFNHKKLFNLLTHTKVGLHHAFLPKDRTPFIQFLVEKQSDNYPYVPMYEMGEKAEDSFLFTIQGETSLYLIWESIRPDTATYVFPVDNRDYEKIRQALFDYVCSSIEYKRLRVHHGVIDGLHGIKCHILNHVSFPQWRDDVLKYLK